MAEGKGYGSGKSRSAANSSMRRRVAAGQTPKSKKGIGAQIKAANAKRAASPLGQFADTILGFALPVGKVKAAAAGLRAAGKVGKAASLEARAFAKTEGRAIRSQVEDLQGGGDFGPTMKWLRRERLLSENIFPKISKYTDGSMFNRYGDMLPKATRKARGIKRVNPQAD